MSQIMMPGNSLSRSLNPLLVHVPVALLVLSLLFDLTNVLTGAGNLYVQAAFVSMALGMATALLALARSAAQREEGWYSMSPQSTLQLLAFSLYVLNLALRTVTLDASTTPQLPLLFSLAGLSALGLWGYVTDQ